MPIYEYVCNACEEHFDLRRKRKDPAPVVCPHCGSSDDSKKLISPPALQFKGSGFYTTDYVKGKMAVDDSGRAREKAKLENQKGESSDSSSSESSSSDSDSSSNTESSSTSDSSSNSDD